MNNYILRKNNFIQEFNLIFNKIPHIYSEVFLKIFSTNYRYFTIFNGNNIPITFNKILEKMFYNYQHPYDYNFFYHNLKKDLSLSLSNNLKEKVITIITKNLSIILASNIEITFLLNLINNNNHEKNYFKDDLIDKLQEKDKIYVYQISESYLIAKSLIKIIDILTLYKSTKNTMFYYEINKSIEKIRTIELIMNNVLDIYKPKYKTIISQSEFKILVYLIILSKNGQDIENNINYNISKILESLDYSTSITKIINYQRGNDYLEILNNKYKNNISTLISYRENPYIYQNINEIINILFYKYHDDYNFIINKEKILKKILYIYIKNVNLSDKIFLCTQYNLWSYEWDSIKEKYEIESQGDKWF